MSDSNPAPPPEIHDDWDAFMNALRGSAAKGLGIETADDVVQAIREDTSAIRAGLGGNVGQQSNPKELLSAKELGKRLDVSPDTIRKWVSRDGCPCIRAGRKLRFREEAVIAWLEARRR
jgi:excisionase family DNA binding protein